MQVLIMLSGIVNPLMKSKSAAELGQHACKPGMQLSWSYIISYVALLSLMYGSMLGIK